VVLNARVTLRRPASSCFRLVPGTSLLESRNGKPTEERKDSNTEIVIAEYFCVTASLTLPTAKAGRILASMLHCPSSQVLRATPRAFQFSACPSANNRLNFKVNRRFQLRLYKLEAFRARMANRWKKNHRSIPEKTLGATHPLTPARKP
jgi:hypothetical protein